MFVEQLADSLRQAGHDVSIYTPLIGPLGLKMRQNGFVIHGHIRDVTEPPDIIHGHHLSPTMTAVAAFPNVPAIFVSHSVEAEFDRPPLHPNIVRYFSVSKFIPKRWASRELPEQAFGILHNAADLDRFTLREPLPLAPRSALILQKHPGHSEAIERACDRSGLRHESYGHSVGNIVDDMPSLFRKFDIVFASGRSALEALCSGCSVVLTEHGRAHGMIRSSDIEHLADLNFGIGALRSKTSKNYLCGEIAKYDSADAAKVTGYVRENLSLSVQLAFLKKTYAEIISSFVPSPNNALAMASIIEDYVPRLGEGNWIQLTQYVAPHLIGSGGPLLQPMAGSRMVDFEERFVQAFGGASAPATAEDILFCFRLLLGRAPSREEWVRRLTMVGSDIRQVVEVFLQSPEIAQRGPSLTRSLLFPIAMVAKRLQCRRRLSTTRSNIRAQHP